MSVLLFLGVLVILPAQENQLRLRFDALSSESFQGVLIRQDPGNEVRISHGSLQQEDMTIRLVETDLTQGEDWLWDQIPPGHYSFFVENTSNSDNFQDWMDYTWLDMVEVQIQLEGQPVQRQTPPVESGRLWHVFDFYTESQFLLIRNTVLPRFQTVYGLVADASGGYGLPGTTIHLINEAGSVVQDFSTRASGLFLFNTPAGEYRLRFQRNGYVSYELPLRVSSTGIPLRKNIVLSSLLPRGQRRAVFTWNAYPEDMDLELEIRRPESPSVFFPQRASRSLENRFFSEFRDDRGFGHESINWIVAEGEEYVLHITQGESPEWLARSGGRLDLYEGSRLIQTLNIPAEIAGIRWTAASWDAPQGSSPLTLAE